MKQLWILLISICCTLTVFGQHQNTDSTLPPKSTGPIAGTGDSGRTGNALPAKKRSSSVSAHNRDTGKAAKTPTQTAATDTGIKSVKRPASRSSPDSSSRSARRLGAGIYQGGSSDSLTPQQLQARRKALAAQQMNETKDSVYKAHKRRILSGLADAALISDNKHPNYHQYFPDYFYDNASSAGNSSGALVSFHAYHNRDLLFYAFIGITFLLALIKVGFPRYFNQVFWFFLHPNDRKNNVSEQISGQNVLPSLLLNLFFVMTGGLFLAQIIRPNLPGADFWTSWALFSLLLTGVYLVKFLIILLSGWVFGAPAAATIYNQVVFSINKIIGLVLLPATLLISYGTAATTGHVFSTVIVIISILLIYRYIASFLLIKGKLKVSAFHFILYLCAVEIIPLLLVYKVLLTNMGRFI